MIFDLSHPLNNETPVFPGTQSPVFKQTATIEQKGYRETFLRFQSHLGTHIDAPAHMLKNGYALDQMDISSFHGKALFIEIMKGILEIDKSSLEQFADELDIVEFVLFKTGWSKFWGDKKYFESFPVLTSEALEYLLTFPLKGIGFDTISADPVESTDYRNHYAIFEKGLIIIENLNFPNDLKESKGEFSCYPLPYEKADGSPVRAVLKV
ncbi:MAG TPA: cyclase family protein [Draconibacterium sp.]|nr:cyclase family protein [Draconibacterium sp.]